MAWLQLKFEMIIGIERQLTSECDQPKCTKLPMCQLRTSALSRVKADQDRTKVMINHKSLSEHGEMSFKYFQGSYIDINIDFHQLWCKMVARLYIYIYINYHLKTKWKSYQSTLSLWLLKSFFGYLGVGFLIGRCRVLQADTKFARSNVLCHVLDSSSHILGLHGHRLKTTTWKEYRGPFRIMRGSRFLSIYKIRTGLIRWIISHIFACMVQIHLVVAGYH